MLAKELQEQIGDLIGAVGNQPVIFRIENNGKPVETEEVLIEIHKGKIYLKADVTVKDLKEENERLRKENRDLEEGIEKAMRDLGVAEGKLEQIQDILDS